MVFIIRMETAEVALWYLENIWVGKLKGKIGILVVTFARCSTVLFYLIL
jgi:hypothetical protein